MTAVLQRIWSLPWPDQWRRRLAAVAEIRLAQRLLFPGFLVGVVALILNDEGKILLLKHTYRPRAPWGLPTGWMEHGEQPGDAVKRELCEEAGLQIELTALHEVRTQEGKANLDLVFRGRYLGGAFKPSAEVSEARFFAADELPPIIGNQRRLALEALGKE